ncbi:MAG TPA: energy transducer TonB [Sphingobacterium sp.]|jgi:protein TonB|nr:energy transducer TonB [Sphingobacterium sp.]
MKGWLVGLFLVLSVHALFAQVDTDTAVVEEVDTYPQFRGGLEGWSRFVRGNLNLRNVINAMDSTAYVDYGLRQTAILEFTVCEDGRVCDIEIANKTKISPEFAEEAMRIMKRSPKWTPARKEGKGVRMRFKQSITAVLQ